MFIFAWVGFICADMCVCVSKCSAGGDDFASGSSHRTRLSKKDTNFIIDPKPAGSFPASTKKHTNHILCAKPK